MLILSFLALNILVLAAIAAFLVFEIYTFIIAPARGSPYAPTRERQIAATFDLADAKSGELLIDLGSGDGTVLIEAASRGIRARGVEINPFFVWYARYRIRRRGFTHLATVARGDLFKHPVADADIIFLYLVPPAMEWLALRLRSEAAPGARILTNLFPLPSWEPEQKREKIFLYRA